MSLFRVCAISRAERVARWVAAVFVAAVPATIGALGLVAMAITGWCPGIPASRSADAAPNALGIPEARQSIDLD